MLPLNGNLFLANEITNSQDFFVEVQIMKRDLKYSVPKTDLMMNLSPQAKIVDRTRLNVNGIMAFALLIYFYLKSGTHHSTSVTNYF